MKRVSAPRIRATQDELNAIREQVALGKSASQIGEAMGRTKRSIVGLVKGHNLGPWRSKHGHAPGSVDWIPTDLEQHWHLMNQAALAKHYGRSASTISLWVRRMGLVRTAEKRFVPVSPKQRAKPKPVAPVKRPLASHGGGHKPAQFEAPQRDMSPVGLAVEYLRRLSAVYRCTETGRADVAGQFWRRGNSVLTDVDVIERADWLRSRERRAA